MSGQADIVGNTPGRHWIRVEPHCHRLRNGSCKNSLTWKYCRNCIILKAFGKKYFFTWQWKAKRCQKCAYSLIISKNVFFFLNTCQITYMFIKMDHRDEKEKLFESKVVLVSLTIKSLNWFITSVASGINLQFPCWHFLFDLYSSWSD